jgi:hypothetical protein
MKHRITSFVRMNFLSRFYLKLNKTDRDKMNNDVKQLTIEHSSATINIVRNIIEPLPLYQSVYLPFFSLLLCPCDKNLSIVWIYLLYFTFSNIKNK